MGPVDSPELLACLRGVACEDIDKEGDSNLTWKAPLEIERSSFPKRHLSSKSLLPVMSMFSRPAMDGLQESLTVERASRARSTSSSSNMSYPQIPLRQSSLSTSLSNDSNGRVTSTRTPSLSDSLYQIEVVKIRQLDNCTHQDTSGLIPCNEEGRLINKVL